MWEAVGVPDTEAQIYETLVHRGQTETATGELATQLGLTNVQATRALTELVAKGMVTRRPGKPARFTAVPPDQAASSLIAQQEQGLTRLRDHAQHLASTYRKARTTWDHPADLVEIIEGDSSIQATFKRLQQEARNQVRGFDRPPYVSNPKDNPDEVQQQEARGLPYRVIYDHTALAIPGRMAEIWNSIHSGEQARVAAVPMKMVLCDDRSALIPASTPDYTVNAGYLIHPSSLLDALIALFEATWQRSVPLNRSPSKGDLQQLTTEDANLLGLLAGGSTDEAISRALDCSVRTVRRHVQRLMFQVGARTRFQLGMEAIRRKWV